MQYPSDIKPLTGLRFIAAFWLLLYFFWKRLGLGEFKPLIIEYGYLGVDLFFILSGFVLAHVYAPQLEKKSYSHLSFLWARLSRVYPLHILMFTVVLTIWFVGKKLGFSYDAHAFDVSQIPYHLTLTQAWRTVNSDGWNFPSWSISAEWFAYLTFPVTAFVVLKFAKNRLLGIGFVFALFLGLFALVYKISGLELTNLTWENGAIRIIPSFMTGIMLWLAGRDIRLGNAQAKAGVVVSVLFLIAAIYLLQSTVAVWIAMVGIVFFVAETSKYQDGGIMSNKTWVYLGEVSFAMYMVHLPVDIITTKGIGFVAPQIIENAEYVTFFAGMILTFIGSIILYELYEKPCRNFMRKHNPFRKKDIAVAKNYVPAE